MEDSTWMKTALEEAKVAASQGEVPVGAVVVYDRRIIAVASNRREEDADPTAHAEILVLRKAAKSLGDWRLEGCTLYVTLEPCAMCAGALVNARVERLVYGASDPKAGFCESLGDLVRDQRLNHQLEVRAGVLKKECSELLKDFFRKLR